MRAHRRTCSMARISLAVSRSSRSFLYFASLESLRKLRMASLCLPPCSCRATPCSTRHATRTPTLSRHMKPTLDSVRARTFWEHHILQYLHQWRACDTQYSVMLTHPQRSLVPQKRGPWGGTSRRAVGVACTVVINRRCHFTRDDREHYAHPPRCSASLHSRVCCRCQGTGTPVHFLQPLRTASDHNHRLGVPVGAGALRLGAAGSPAWSWQMSRFCWCSCAVCCT